MAPSARAKRRQRGERPWGQRLRQRRVTDAGLLLVLVASTLITYSGAVVSSFWDDGAFYLALLLPGLYGFTLGATALNKGRNRQARVLAATGAAAGLLTIALLQLASGFADPDQINPGEVGRLLLAPPLAAILLAGACSALRRPA